MQETFSQHDEEALCETFSRYRSAFPDREPGANFMPELWARIESRHTFAFVFGRLSRAFASASASLCLVLLVLNLLATPRGFGSYADALLADSSAEQTYYLEAIGNAPAIEDASPR